MHRIRIGRRVYPASLLDSLEIRHLGGLAGHAQPVFPGHSGVRVDPDLVWPELHEVSCITVGILDEVKVAGKTRWPISGSN